MLREPVRRESPRGAEKKVVDSGAHGYFEVTHDITQYCKADMFSRIGKQTPCFFRFSTVGGESGSADTARDPRGFAMKFYTEEGNWDLVRNALDFNKRTRIIDLCSGGQQHADLFHPRPNPLSQLHPHAEA